MIRIRAPRDFFAGLLFIGIGLLGATLATGYAFGSALRMGPGYFPTVLSWCTIGLGAIVALRALALDGPPIAAVRWRPLVCVLAAICLFGLLIAPAGLLLAIVAAAIVGGFATREMGRIEGLLLALGLAAFCAAVFVYGLGLPINLWPG
jgi:hypothetical protein